MLKNTLNNIPSQLFILTNFQIGTRWTNLEFIRVLQYIFITLIADISVIQLSTVSFCFTTYGLISLTYRQLEISLSVGSVRSSLCPTKL